MDKITKKYLDENVASPVGVWLRSGTTVYRLKERTDPMGFHNGQRLRENEIHFCVSARGHDSKAEQVAEKITELLNKANI